MSTLPTLLCPFDSNALDLEGHILALNGSASISTIQSKWGGSSLFLDNNNNAQIVDAGTTPSGINIPHDDAFGISANQPFCIELWFYPVQSPTATCLLISNGADGQYIRYFNWALQFVGTNNWLEFSLGHSPDKNIHSGTLSVSPVNFNTWNFVKVNSQRMYLNGDAGAPLTNQMAMIQAAAPDSGDCIRIGGWWGYYGICFGGYINDLRITIGDDKASEPSMPTAKFPTSYIDLINNYASLTATMTINPNMTFMKLPQVISYMDITNTSKLSDAVIAQLLTGSNTPLYMFDGGTISFYTGDRPTSANNSPTGSLIGTLTNINFTLVSNTGRAIQLDSSKSWQLTAAIDGVIGWYRITAPGDNDQDSTMFPRIDGRAGEDMPANISVMQGHAYPINGFTLTLN